ncbi:hypothetical protein [Variovorax saccharolyticus]|uniref:hypothetical protein n=1 Tax=Variovorax saccharolyticus TaxID=3053516 RepID=UPI00257856D3|nr:hypothetical protein [Variovorax sp. J22R187]MDM0018378.1 hypothetical protein [Variovorax sp. J22R187]
MQLAVTALIDAARSRFAPEAPAGPVAPAAGPVQPQPFASLESPLTTYALFVRSPLSVATNPVLADLIDVIFRDASVQRAAGACAAKRLRLIELAGFKSEISAAIRCVVANAEDLNMGSISPAAVVEVLRQRAEDIDDAIEDCREDHAAHQAASRALMARHGPLRAAVGKHLTQLTAERDHLSRENDAAAIAASIGVPGASRYAVLRSAGLSDEQIAATEPTAVNPEIMADRRRARIAAIAPQIEKLKAFGEAPNFDAAPIIGIDPALDDLIAARASQKAAA